MENNKDYRREIKGNLELTHDEFCALYAAVEQLLFCKDGKPNKSGLVGMNCYLYEREIENLIAIHRKLKRVE